MLEPMMKAHKTGFTLIEVMIVVAILAVLLAVAAPSFNDQVARRRLEGAANELTADLQYARTEAISKNKQVILSTHTSGNSYTIDYVSGPVSFLKNVSSLPSGVTITSDTSVTFDPLRGMPTSATNFTLASTATSATLRARVNAAGRIQICSPDASFKGYTTC